MKERSVVVWIPERKDAAWITIKDKDTFVGDGYIILIVVMVSLVYTYLKSA